jgi:hypothetical protein
MLIEIFTDGRVLIDGQDQGPHFKAERMLKDYLLSPEKLMQEKSKAA